MYVRTVTRSGQGACGAGDGVATWGVPWKDSGWSGLRVGLLGECVHALAGLLG